MTCASQSRCCHLTDTATDSAPYVPVGVPTCGRGLQGGNLRQRLEQRHLVGGNLAATVQDAFNLVHGPQRPTVSVSQLQRQRVPDGARLAQRIPSVPAGDQLEGDVLKQQLEALSGAALDEAAVGVALVTRDVVALQRQQWTPTGFEQTPEREGGVKEVGR